MQKLIECVPNFSERRDQNIIHQITDAIESVDGVSLLDVDTDASRNREVVAVVSSLDPRTEAAFRGVKKPGKLGPMNLDAGSLRESLTHICRHFRVERLYLFGSAADERFNSERSDLDFLVTLEDQPPGEYADNYLGLAQALEKLFGRPADLVTERSIRNPYFRETVFAAHQLLYDRRDEKAVA